MSTIPFSLEYFIDKFEGIPEDQWITEDFEQDNCCCALGHCGVRWNSGHYDAEFTAEAVRFTSVFMEKVNQTPFKWLSVPAVNDGNEELIRLGETPKERILTVLKSTPEELYKLLTF